jgi:hypothetical protein
MAEVANGTSQPGQQNVDVFSPSGSMSIFASGLYEPYGIADQQTNPSSAPEPGSIVLLGAGLAAIGVGRLRRRRG